MPTEIMTVEEFIKLSESAVVCRVKRIEDVVKLKLRTQRSLYTIKVNEVQAETILKNIKCEVSEV